MSQPMENKVVIDGQTYYGGLNQPNLKFVKVNVDCWEKIFDFLSLRDILAMSQTCQRMRQIGGYYYRENFHGTECELNESSPELKISINENPQEREDFLRFVDTIKIKNSLNHLRAVPNMDFLPSLKTLELHSINLNGYQLRGFENIQKNIETIELIECSIEDNSLGEFLTSCPKLKNLELFRLNFKSTSSKSSFFQSTYPMLERIDFYGNERNEMDELIPFLEQNPNIKRLCIGYNELKRISSNSSKIQLDCLKISVNESDDIAAEHLNRLKTLHANGCFKKLRLSIKNDFDAELIIQQMISFDALEALSSWGFYTNAINDLTQLKEFILLRFNNNSVDLETMAIKLVHLERLRFFGTVTQLSSFLRHSKKLKFVNFSDESSEDDALNVFELNRVRKLGGIQHKIQIGVHGKQYLATKWMENGVSFDLVEITREETIRQHFKF